MIQVHIGQAPSQVPRDSGPIRSEALATFESVRKRERVRKKAIHSHTLRYPDFADPHLSLCL